MCSVKSPFLSCASSDLTYTKSNLSFKPYTPEGVFTVFSLFLPWFSVYFSLKLKLLLSNCRSHQACCNFSIWRSKLEEKIQQSLKCIYFCILILTGEKKKGGEKSWEEDKYSKSFSSWGSHARIDLGALTQVHQIKEDRNRYIFREGFQKDKAPDPTEQSLFPQVLLGEGVQAGDALGSRSSILNPC